MLLFYFGKQVSSPENQSHARSDLNKYLFFIFNIATIQYESQSNPLKMFNGTHNMIWLNAHKKTTDIVQMSNELQLCISIFICVYTQQNW